MIEHVIHFFEKGFTYTWHLQLPYRLLIGDFVHYELILNKGKLQRGKDIDDKFYNLRFDEHLVIERSEIDHIARVVVWLNTPVD